MSGDGNCLTLRKHSWLPAWEKSDFDIDTILIFDIRKPGINKVAGYRTAIRNLLFTENAILLLSDSLQTELFNLEKQTSIYFEHIKQTEALISKKQFLLHYNKQEKNRLELRDNNGKLLKSLDNVSRYYTTKQGHIYAITEAGKSESEVTLLNDCETEQLYETSREIKYLNIDPNEKSMMVLEQGSEENSQEIVFLDIENKATYPLKEVLPAVIQRGYTDAISEGISYFLRIYVEKEKPTDTIVDIWYGSDNKLEEKFYPPIDVLTFVWEPVKHNILRIGTGNLTTSFYIGNDRYFLSFNPYTFQDYTTEHAMLQMNVYDRFQDQYSVLDTIDPVLRLSASGEYALSPKEREWYLYHIPSGNKNLIPGKNLRNPWFTEDGKAVLFEGDEALWLYELNNGKLTEAAGFKGYQASIVNYDWEGLSVPHGSFNKCTVNLQKPLVIKLYDAQKNVTSYILWHKGKSEVIVPSTTGYIQNLHADEAYKHFGYIEEDYNLPPRFVYKELGKEVLELYQSNRTDKDILSLKQEIIPYTNSNNIPLKGILYYPLNYSSSKKYPIVVHIYEKQRHYSNLYPYPSYNDELGFNIRLLIEKGYFVYMPDILIQGMEGFGIDALDCVNHALDAIADNPSVDMYKIGLAGHSFGGSETNFISTHSNRFAAYVSGSGHSDIIRAYHAFNYNFLWPDYIRIEANLYKMGVPFSANKDLYHKNNPINYAEMVSAPVLLWSGLEDQNVTSDHTIAFYNALRRNNKDVVALLYKGEGHGLRKQQSQFDLTSRILDWFDYFLKGDTGIDWIKKGIE